MPVKKSYDQEQEHQKLCSNLATANTVLISWEKLNVLQWHDMLEFLFQVQNSDDCILKLWVMKEPYPYFK